MTDLISPHHPVPRLPITPLPLLPSRALPIRVYLRKPAANFRFALPWLRLVFFHLDQLPNFAPGDELDMVFLKQPPKSFAGDKCPQVPGQQA
jgi:hypothetical protein